MRTVGGLLTLAGVASAAAVPNVNGRNVHVVRADADLNPNENCKDVPDDQPCTIVGASEDYEFYGERLPRSVADELWEKCISNGCNLKDFETDTRDITGLGPYDTTLTVTVHGDYFPEYRHALVFAMTEAVGALQVQYTKTEQRPPVQGADVVTMDVWKAPRYVHINRHVKVDGKWLPEGFLSFSTAKSEDEGNTCEGILDALDSVLGPLHENVGLVLGGIKSACAATG
ncbi:hypothetical protein NLU13_3550 [Sarocladium strictum]|uniref:Uncharacterized protein n=1 Tax=Sarocladium strictum TaxID=5046 RepID=A0AA39GM95_SARSR|nr:hypothetical protein NLU13_3550 [Sarocladium strictum]